MMHGIIEQLTHSTVRIECDLISGGSSTGSGFVVNLLHAGDNHCPVIVSNKHVIEGGSVGRIHLTYSAHDGSPELGNHQQLVIDNFEQRWILHPDPKIDLAVMPLVPLINKFVAMTGRRPFFAPIGRQFIADDALRASLSPMEDILMIGYPNGIWDQVNNLPVIRRGITATHAKLRWNGKDEFLADIAAFPGSSGSPVFLANIGSYIDGAGNIFMGETRVHLLGILYAGTQHRVDGMVEVITIPTDTKSISRTHMPNNLGIVVNSQRILDFEPIVQSMIDLITRPNYKFGASRVVPAPFLPLESIT